MSDTSAADRTRGVLPLAVLASSVAFLDSTVVNVALPAIADELGGGIVTQQWTVDAYLLTLGALILVAGSISDAVGKLRVLRIGTIAFATTSVLVAVAPNPEVLIVARALQGVAGALLVPSSLALVSERYEGRARATAIGSWTAWTTVATLGGPLLGGLVVDLASWRIAFVLNLPVAVLALLVAARVAPDAAARRPRIDVPGAVLGVVALGGIVLALIEAPRLGVHPVVVVAGLVGVAAAAAFVVLERRVAEPMLPLSLFRERDFTAGNGTTLFVYGALGLVGFAVPIVLQQEAGLSATIAALALLPGSVLLAAGSTLVGNWSARIGARTFMTAGPLVAAVGCLLLLRIDGDASFAADVLPGSIVLGVGLTLTVAPLTSAVLAAVEERRSGVASAVNNAVARIAGLVAVAFAGIAAGGAIDVAGAHRVLVLCAVLLGVGAVVSFVGIRGGRSEPSA